MNILLLGEFSGFYHNLKTGLENLNHNVCLFSSGDSWKLIKNNSFFYTSKFKIFYLKHIHILIKQINDINRLKNFDVVQLIAPNIFHLYQLNINQLLLKRIYLNNDKLFLSVAGDHYYTIKNDYNLRYAHINKAHDNFLFKLNNDYVLSLVKGIIPICYSYAEPYRTHEKIKKTIPLPIDTKSTIYISQEFWNNKVVIFHGINREKAKGSSFIIKAMQMIQKKYPNDVEIIIDGKMPLEKYLKVLKKTNIVVDQALSYSYGMNAIYSMAMGKVVLSGNEPECKQEFGRDDIPIINILPSVEDIFVKLEHLVLNRDLIIEIGKKSRLFVEDFHDCDKIAQRYLEVWTQQ